MLQSGVIHVACLCYTRGLFSVVSADQCVNGQHGLIVIVDAAEWSIDGTEGSQYEPVPVSYHHAFYHHVSYSRNP